MSDEVLKSVPFSLEAEQAVLGSILIDPSSLDSLQGIISAEDFMVPEHVQIYSVMTDMYAKNREIDVVTLIDELVKNGTYDDVGGKNYIYTALKNVPSNTNLMDYANIVREKSMLRSLIKVCDEIEESSYAGEDAGTVLELAESKIFSISKNHENKDFISLRDSLQGLYKNLQLLSKDPESMKGVPTGFSTIDEVLVGMGRSDLVLIGARPGMGKTSLAMNIAQNFAKHTEKNICIFSLEMSSEQLALRMLSSEAAVDSTKMRSGQLSGDDWEKMSHAASELASYKILIDDSSDITVSGMRSKLRRVKNLGLVIIDYLQLMHSERRIDNRVQEVGDISRNLKIMAKEFDVPVICCAQLSRGPEGRNDKRPALSDLRDSGAIEQDADTVMFIYRDDYYGENKDEKASSSAPGTAEIIVAKNRHGSLGRVKIGWLPQYTKFISIENRFGDESE